MVRCRPTQTSCGSELEDDANPQLDRPLEAVRELQEHIVEKQKQIDEHQRQQVCRKLEDRELRRLSWNKNWRIESVSSDIKWRPPRKGDEKSRKSRVAEKSSLMFIYIMPIVLLALEFFLTFIILNQGRFLQDMFRRTYVIERDPLETLLDVLIRVA